MIKKMIAPLALVMLLCAACKKENDTAPVSALAPSEEVMTSGNRVAPATFTQKLLIEMFGTSYCATCPDMEQKCRYWQNKHPNRVFGYVSHNSDKMDIGLYDYLDSVYNVTTYASGMLNRTVYGGMLDIPKQYWTNYVNTALNQTANCGLEIVSTVSGNTATIKVSCGFNAVLSGNYNLTALLYQDSIVGFGAGYDQSNYYNNITGSLWYHLGNPIVGYQHDFVSRKVLSTTAMGTAIPSAYIVPGGVYTKTYTVDISTYNKRQLNVIAFINKAGSVVSGHKIMNVQGCKVGTTQLFD